MRVRTAHKADAFRIRLKLLKLSLSLLDHPTSTGMLLLCVLCDDSPNVPFVSKESGGVDLSSNETVSRSQ